MRRLACSFALCAAAVLGCDGTIAGIGRTERPPEIPLPPPSAETATPGGEGAAGASKAPRPEQIAAQHLLVMFAGAKAAGPHIKRTRDEARARAEEAHRRAVAGEDFGKLVAEYSEEPGAAARKGDLGRFSHDMMVKPFADAAFALEPGQISRVVETTFGFHVIKRTE